jgi:hypothetical protein
LTIPDFLFRISWSQTSLTTSTRRASLSPLLPSTTPPPSLTRPTSVLPLNASCLLPPPAAARPQPAMREAEAVAERPEPRPPLRGTGAPPADPRGCITRSGAEEARANTLTGPRHWPPGRHNLLRIYDAHWYYLRTVCSGITLLRKSACLEKFARTPSCESPVKLQCHLLQ